MRLGCATAGLSSSVRAARLPDMSASQHPTTGYRKRVKHYDEPGHCHLLTFSCYDRLPLLTNDLWRQMLSVAIDRAMGRHKFQLVAFVYMPEHVHLIVYPTDESPKIDALLKAIKRLFSYRFKQLLEVSQSPLLGRLTIRQRPGVRTVRFWQEGPGHDRNLTSPQAALAAVDYLHMNPVRRGLCACADNSKWSSASYFVPCDSPLDPDLPAINALPAGWLDSNGT